ncbi:hypothetical protein I308_105520 [Cryptococcus tetragattii IND107]|uniref:STB6-like N-terminal domain-containing protein n=1 Tax=Cryptococcus tetragattii IND107 TaxID=1296105 RepID=A0ABR3BL93_9TREE
MSYVLSPSTLFPASHANTPTTPCLSPSPSPNAEHLLRPSSNGLLIPTDRTQDVLETKWLGMLGRLRVEREVILKGYALYSLRTWTHFAHTIVTQTGKPNDQISAYLLVPSAELSESEGDEEVANAIQFLSSETRSQPRRTELGFLLVTSPSAFGQDVNPVPGGDFRVAKSYIVVNTALRRLGCGGRAVLGLEPPIAALRRKFHDLYRVPVPVHSGPMHVRNSSPSASPTRTPSISGSPHDLHSIHPLAFPPSSARSPVANGHDINSDPFTYLVIELVKLIQAALALWGMFQHVGEDIHGRLISLGMEVDGLFCDETKSAIFRWRREMGMEYEGSLKIEKETSGGCIDPKTLASLLSSITSVHYQLDALDVERGDHLRVQRLLTGVAQTASHLSANLKGGGGEETSLRWREHQHRHRLDEQQLEDPGMVMIIPDDEIGSIAPPDAITTHLEAYIKCILKSKEKEWDVMGARRIAELWNGSLADSVEGRRKRRGTLTLSLGRGGSRERGKGVLRKRTSSRDDTMREEEGREEGDLRGTIKEISERAGQALRGGMGIMSRKGIADETSDSETGGPGPSSQLAALIRKKHGPVPTVIEPDAVDENHPEPPSVSPSTSSRQLPSQLAPSPFSIPSKPNLLSHTSRTPSRTPSGRPPTIIIPSGNESEVWSRVSGYPGKSPGEERSDLDLGYSHVKNNKIGSVAGRGTSNAVSKPASERAIAWRNKGRSTVMLRSSSDGADVALDETGMEWEVRNPHGTGKREGEAAKLVARRHSFNDLDDYKGARMLSPQHLQIDVEMCLVALKLRQKERQLAQKVKDVKLLEEAVYTAASQLGMASRARHAHIETLKSQAEILCASLEALKTEEDLEEQLPYDRFHYYLSEETHRAELLDDLGRLKEMWENVRKEGDERRRKLEKKDAKKTWWFW